MRYSIWPCCAALFLLAGLLATTLAQAAGPTAVKAWATPRTAADSTVDFGNFRVTPIDAPMDTVRVPIRMLLSWNAPYGHPRASTDRTYTPGDTTGSDTLYLAFDPVADHPRFVGYMATLYMRPVEGDTLGRFWKYTSGKGQRPIAKVDFPDSSLLGVPPWPMRPVSGARYEHLPASAEIKLLGAVNPLDSTPIVGGTIYTLGRIVIRRPDGNDPQELKPMCVEFASLLLTFSVHKGDEQTHRSGEQRYVAYRDPLRAACGDLLPKPQPGRSATAASKRGR